MSRAEITYAEVATVADLLVSESETPTAKSINKKLGNSSCLGTIQKHLITWREACQSTAPTRIVEVSPDLKAVWIRELEKQITLTKSESDDNIELLSNEVNAMATEVERVDAERADIRQKNEELEALTSDLKEQLSAKAAENTTLIESLELEKKTAENGRIALVKEQLKLDGSKEQLDIMRGQLLEAEREVTDAGNAKSDAKRKNFETEKLLAVEESKVEGLNEQNRLKADQIQRLELEKEGLKQQLSAAVKELKEALQGQKNAEIQAAAGEGRVKHLNDVQEELMLAKGEIKELKKDNQKLREMLNSSYLSNS